MIKLLCISAYQHLHLTDKSFYSTISKVEHFIVKCFSLDCQPVSANSCVLKEIPWAISCTSSPASCMFPTTRWSFTCCHPSPPLVANQWAIIPLYSSLLPFNWAICCSYGHEMNVIPPSWNTSVIELLYWVVNHKWFWLKLYFITCTTVRNMEEKVLSLDLLAVSTREAQEGKSCS